VCHHGSAFRQDRIFVSQQDFVFYISLWCSLRNLLTVILHNSFLMAVVARGSAVQFSIHRHSNTWNTPQWCHSILVLYHNLKETSYSVQLHIRRGADKSLARPTSRCRRTESIVSLEIGVCSCAKLQVFSCYRDWKEACQATRAISTTSRRELSWSFFPPERQGAEVNSRHSERNIRGTCTIVYYRQKLVGPV